MAATLGGLNLFDSSLVRDLHDLVSDCRVTVANSAYLLRKSRDMGAMNRVLLFDSDSDTAEMYAVGLRMEGFVAAVAPDPAIAIDHIRRGNPDAVVVEMTDAARDDWEIVRWCRSGGAGRVLPVVLITGHPQTAIPDTASNLGCAAMLMKPCLPETLARVVRAVIAGASPTAQRHPPSAG